MLCRLCSAIAGINLGVWVFLLLLPLLALRAQFVRAMEESSQPPKPLEMNPHSRFIIGSVSEDNSEDETSSLVKLDLLEEKERSLSPASVCSDSLSDLGLSNAQDGLASHMRYGSNSAAGQPSAFLPHPFQR